MPSKIPPFDDGNPDDREVEAFSLDSAHAALEGCRCEEADLLRALSIKNGNSDPNSEVVDLGSLGHLAHKAMCQKRGSNGASLTFSFAEGAYYRLNFHKGNRDPVPKCRVVREVIMYFSKNSAPMEFTRPRSSQDLDRGELVLGDDIRFQYTLVPEPFGNG